MGDRHFADTPWFPTPSDPFAKHFGPSPAPVVARFGALSHRGLVRSNNEDHFVVIERRRGRAVLMTNLPDGCLQPAEDVAYLMAVADGIGGAAFGELASLLALRSGWDQASNAINWTWVVTEAEVANLKERVSLVFQRIHERLLEHTRVEPSCAGMGTTLTGVYTVGPEAFVAHVGDSRAYRYHAGVLSRLTRDHTLAQESLDAGLPVESKSWYHALTNCLGANGHPLWVEFHHFRLADRDQLLLCTDGLSDLVTDEEIAQVLLKGLPPAEAVQELIEAALARGGRDNITAALAQYEVPCDYTPPS